MEQKELERIKNGLQYRFDLFKGRLKDYLYFVGVKDYAYFIIGNTLLKAFTDDTINAPKSLLDIEIEKIRALVHKDIDSLYSTLLPELRELSLNDERLRTAHNEFIKNDEFNDVSATAYHLRRTIEIAATITQSTTIQSLCTLTTEGGLYKVKAKDNMYFDVDKSKVSQFLSEFEKLIEKRKKQGETKLWGSFALLGTAAACVNKIENGETDNPSYYAKEMLAVWQESSPNSFSRSSLFVNSGTYSVQAPSINETNYFLKTDYDFHAQKIHNCLIEFLDQKITETNAQEKNDVEHIKIKNITIVEAKTGSRHQVVINGGYEKPMEINCLKGAWNLLWKVAKKDYIQYDSKVHDSLFDYLNTNRKCRLYAGSSYDLTRILAANQDKVVASIPIEVISQKAYQQRLNKL